MFKGSNVALITPFKNNALDEEAYIKLIHFHIDNGTSGLVPAGTTGESPTLSHKEHQRVIDLCIKESEGRIPVIAGTGSNSTDAEGEKNFTITEEHFNEALKNYPEIKERLEIFVDWDEENFEKSMSNSDILLAWNFPTKNLKKISPNLKWIHVVSSGVEHLLPLDWMYDDLILTNSSGVHALKAGEYGLMAILMLQNHMTQIVTNQKKK